MSLGFPPTATGTTGPNNGLGKVYFYAHRLGYLPVQDGHYDSEKMSFTERTTNDILHVDYIKQDTPDVWKTCILGKSEGFTKPGVERLNDSIRDICLDNPRRTGPDTSRHPDVAGQHHLFRCAEAVFGKHRGRHFGPSRPPLGNQPLSGCLAVRRF